MIAALLLALPLFASARGEISVGAGLSTNPFELPARPVVGGTAPEPGTFVPVHGYGVLRTDAERGFRFAARASLDADLFAWITHDPHAVAPTHPVDASTGSAAVSAPADWITGDDARRVTLTVEPFAGLHRETFTSPVTGRPYIANSIDPPNSVSLARRFDTNRAGAKAAGELELGPNADFFTSVSFQHVDYVEDFKQVTAIAVDSWDYDELRLDADAWFYPSFGVINAAWSMRRRGYDARFPHSSDGTQVLPSDAGFTPQVFWFQDGTVKVGIDGERGRVVLRADIERRIDAFAGYLDYTDAGLSLDLRTDVGDWTLSSQPAISFRRYDIARVNFDPIEPSNQHMRLDLGARVERHLRNAASAFVEAGWTRQDSSNDLYDFDAVRVTTGIRFSWR